MFDCNLFVSVMNNQYAEKEMKKAQDRVLWRGVVILIQTLKYKNANTQTVQRLHQ